jgi:multimeric flavodoxin WrbA
VSEGEIRRLLVVAHDPSPNTRRMVEAVLYGAEHEDVDRVETRHVRPLEAGPDDVLACDAIVLGTTENLGYMSGALKDFFDRTYYRVIERTEGLPYALYVRAGMDGTGTRRAVESICTGLSWRPVQEPLICRGEWRDAFLEQCEELGLYMAASLDTDII